MSQNLVDILHGTLPDNDVYYYLSELMSITIIIIQTHHTNIDMFI